MAQGQGSAPQVILEHGVCKLDQILGGVRQLSQQPALHGPGQGDGIELGDQVLNGEAGLPGQPVHGALDDAVNIFLKQTLEVAASHGTQGAQAKGVVVLNIVEQLQETFLPELGPLVLAQQDQGLLLKHPFEQIVYIREVVVKGLPAQAAAVGDLPDGDLLQRLLRHALLQCVGQLVLGVFGCGVFHGVSPWGAPAEMGGR